LRPHFAVINLGLTPNYREDTPVDSKNLINTSPYFGNGVRYDVGYYYSLLEVTYWLSIDIKNGDLE